MSYTYNIFARTAGVDSVHAGEAYTFRVPRRILYAWPALSDWYEAMIREKLGGTIMRCDSDSGKKLIKSMVLRTADRQGMC